MFRPTNVSVPCDVVVDNVHDDLINYKHSNSTTGWFVDGGYGNDHGYLIYNNTLASAMDSGFQLTFTFEGTGVVVYGAQNAQDLAFKGVKSNGLIAISTYDLDGVTTTFASSPDIAYGVLFFQSGPLPFDNHTLTVTVTQATTESPYLLDYIGYNTTSSYVAVPLAPAQSTYIPASAIVGCALIWAATLLATVTASAVPKTAMAYARRGSVFIESAHSNIWPSTWAMPSIL